MEATSVVEILDENVVSDRKRHSQCHSSSHAPGHNGTSVHQRGTNYTCDARYACDAPPDVVSKHKDSLCGIDSNGPLSQGEVDSGYGDDNSVVNGHDRWNFDVRGNHQSYGEIGADLWTGADASWENDCSSASAHEEKVPNLLRQSGHEQRSSQPLSNDFTNQYAEYDDVNKPRSTQYSYVAADIQSTHGGRSATVSTEQQNQQRFQTIPAGEQARMKPDHQQSSMFDRLNSQQEGVYSFTHFESDTKRGVNSDIDTSSYAGHRGYAENGFRTYSTEEGLRRRHQPDYAQKREPFAEPPDSLEGFSLAASALPASFRYQSFELAKDVVSYVSFGEDYSSCAHPSRCAEVLRNLVDDTLKDRQKLYKEMTKKLDIKHRGELKVLDQIATQMFDDECVNWGRIVSLCAFCGYLAKHCEERCIADCREDIARKLGFILVNRLGLWLVANGGWMALERLFPSLSFWLNHSFWKGLGICALLLGALLAFYSSAKAVTGGL